MPHKKNAKSFYADVQKDSKQDKTTKTNDKVQSQVQLKKRQDNRSGNTSQSHSDRTTDKTSLKCAACSQSGHNYLFKCPKLPSFVFSKYPKSLPLPSKMCKICLATDTDTDGCTKHKNALHFVFKSTGYSPLLCECPSHKALHDYLRS